MVLYFYMVFFNTIVIYSAILLYYLSYYFEICSNGDALTSSVSGDVLWLIRWTWSSKPNIYKLRPLADDNSELTHIPSGKLTVCYGKWPIYSEFSWIFPWNMVLFHSYVSLPEGNFGEFYGFWGVITSGWWCNNHLEKWWSSSMGRMTSHIKWKIKNV